MCGGLPIDSRTSAVGAARAGSYQCPQCLRDVFEAIIILTILFYCNLKRLGLDSLNLSCFRLTLTFHHGPRAPLLTSLT